MAKILFQTQKGYNIREGKQYLVITKDGEGLEEKYSLQQIVATGQEPNGVVERWFDNVQAKESLDRLNEEAIVRVKELKIKIEEEEKQKRGSIMEQLMKVTSEDEFVEFLNSNGFVLTSTTTRILIQNAKGLPIFDLHCNISDLPGCCGGKEHCSHDGSWLEEFPVMGNKEYITQLAKYLTPFYDRALSLDCNGYNIVSYILSPGGAGWSSIWGYIFSNSDYFDKTGSFTNRNTDNRLDVYITNEDFDSMYDESEEYGEEESEEELDLDLQAVEEL